MLSNNLFQFRKELYPFTKGLHLFRLYLNEKLFCVGAKINIKSYKHLIPYYKFFVRFEQSQKITEMH